MHGFDGSLAWLANFTQQTKLVASDDGSDIQKASIFECFGDRRLIDIIVSK